MPSQVTSAAGAVFYVENDTAPPLVATLLDGADQPIDLTGATVTITIGYARYSYYYSPTKAIVVDGPCVVDPDQVNNRGVVRWYPQEGDLSPPGEFLYTFQITYQDDTVQTMPPNRYLPLTILTPIPGKRDSVTGAP